MKGCGREMTELGIKDFAAEPVLLGAGGRAILLQVANPGVGHGVDEHSDFAYRALDRLRATMTYILMVTHGTDEERDRAVRAVNRAHVPVHSVEGADVPYNAFDPDLQLWVAATLYDSAIRLYELVFGTLSEKDADRVYRDYAILGTSLQVPEDRWPADRAAFDRYWNAQIDSFVVDSAARRVARDLFRPNVAPFFLRMLLPAYRVVTTALLPEQLREQFGLPWDARRRRGFEAFMAVVRFVYPKVPRRVRNIPKDVAMWDMRRRARAD